MSVTRIVEPTEARYTKWHNPLSVEQSVLVYGNDPRVVTKYKFPPGDTVSVPSELDGVIHVVHGDTIVGGMAPQLVKVGSTDKLDPVLDTNLAEKRKAEAEAAMASLARQAAEEAELIASAKALAAKKREDAKKQ